MYTSQDTPSVSNKRVRLTLIIALIVIGSWSVRSCLHSTIALDAKVSAFHAKWLRAVYGFRVHLNRVSIIVCFGSWYFYSVAGLPCKVPQPKTNPPILHKDLQIDSARLLLSNCYKRIFIISFVLAHSVLL